MEDMDEEQSNAVNQAFGLDYDVAQAFCSHIVPKAVLLFTGEARNNDMDLEPEDGEVDDDNEGGTPMEENILVSPLRPRQRRLNDDNALNKG